MEVIMDRIEKSSQELNRQIFDAMRSQLMSSIPKLIPYPYCILYLGKSGIAELKIPGNLMKHNESQIIKMAKALSKKVKKSELKINTIERLKKFVPGDLCLTVPKTNQNPKRIKKMIREIREVIRV